MTESPFKIEIADQQEQEFEPEPMLRSVAAILRDHEICSAEISLAVVDDPTIRQLNKQYLAHDYETDVISFVLDWDPDSAHLVGQLIVSSDTAATLADEVGSSMQEELLLYVIHGTLHLVGFDDKDPDSAAQMRLAEKKYLEAEGWQHRGFDQASVDVGQDASTETEET